MKPSNCANIGGPRQRAATLYLKAALAGGLLLVLLAVTLGDHTAAAVASKSDRPREAAPATSGRPSSSSLSSASQEDQLALPSSTTATTTTTTSKRLVPISHKETVSTASTRSSTRSSDLSVGQSNLAHAKVHSSPQDMQTAAGHHYGKSHGKFYMYAESPKKGAYKAGFARGNHKHMIERKEYQHKSHAGGHMKWHDKKGKGSHKWEYKHYDKKGKHHYG